MPGAKPSYPQTFIAQIVSQTFISVKPSYAGFGHYTLNTMVCQAHFAAKPCNKKTHKWGKICGFRNLFFKKF